MNNKILNRHLSWISKGLQLEDILSIRADFKKSYPETPVSTEAIDQKVGGQEASVVYTESDLHKLRYLVVDDADFEGNLEFLKFSTNLESIFISGRFSERKISDLQPLANLKSLNRLHLAHHNIEDLSPLAPLKNLTEIDLHQNRLRTIDPISKHQEIRKARFSSVGEEEIMELLQNSNEAVVTFSPRDVKPLTYHGLWINDYAFKACFRRERNRVSVTVEPIRAEDGRMPLITTPENLKGIILKTKELASLLMNRPPALETAEFSYIEKSNVLKGIFLIDDSPATSQFFQDELYHR